MSTQTENNELIWIWLPVVTDNLVMIQSYHLATHYDPPKHWDINIHIILCIIICTYVAMYVYEYLKFYSNHLEGV